MKILVIRSWEGRERSPRVSIARWATRAAHLNNGANGTTNGRVVRVLGGCDGRAYGQGRLASCRQMAQGQGDPRATPLTATSQDRCMTLALDERSTGNLERSP